MFVRSQRVMRIELGQLAEVSEAFAGPTLLLSSASAREVES